MENKETVYFCIADHYVKLTFNDTSKNNMYLMRSYMPFQVPAVADDKLLFEMIVDDTLQPVEKSRRKRIRDFETGNGHTVVDAIEGGGYQFIFKDHQGIECGMFQIDKTYKHVVCAVKGTYDMRSFGIHNSFMLSFGISGTFHQTLLIHASLVRHNGYGYAFHAISGTGKSTQVSNWLRFIPNCDLMNDDNPAIRVIDGKAYIYGTPWSGKTTCYRKTRAPLGGLIRIDRDSRNWVEKLSPIEAFTSVCPSCNTLRWDVEVYRKFGDNVTKVVETTNVYILHCLPDRESAEICHEAVAIKA